MTDELSVWVVKITSRIGISWTHSQTFCFWPNFNSLNSVHIYKIDNFESQNFLKLCFASIWGLRLNFVDCEFSLESNSPGILTLCETNLDDSIDSGTFSVRGYLLVIQKDCTIHMHGLAVYVKEGLPFPRELFLENYANSYLCFRLALLHSVSYFFFFYWSPSLSLYTVFILFHLTQMRFSQSTHLLICLSLNTLTSIIRTG